MSNQKNDIDVKEQQTEKNENASGGFDQVLEFCRKHIHHIAVDSVCIILFIVLIKYTGNLKETPVQTETEET